MHVTAASESLAGFLAVDLQVMGLSPLQNSF